MVVSSPFTGAAGHARHLTRHLAAYILVLVCAVGIPALVHAQPVHAAGHIAPVSAKP